ncbi:hypothetical protein [Kribbella sp. NPDC051718]|uniref:hypothetical protein n=1 Tax=Kribbella sp. NPDC051718 TaxID=3155168 RepID=UPI0034249992
MDPRRLACPSCGDTPGNNSEAARLREELQTEWWSASDQDPARIVVTQHCGRCQPHTVYAMACLACGDGPLLAGELAELARDADPQQLPAVVTEQLIADEWQWATTSSGTGWICRRDAAAQQPNPIRIEASR